MVKPQKNNTNKFLYSYFCKNIMNNKKKIINEKYKNEGLVAIPKKVIIEITAKKKFLSFVLK